MEFLAYRSTLIAKVRLAVDADGTVVFVDYDRAAEHRYPVAIEEAYAMTRYISEHAEDSSAFRGSDRFTATVSIRHRHAQSSRERPAKPGAG